MKKRKIPLRKSVVSGEMIPKRNAAHHPFEKKEPLRSIHPARCRVEGAYIAIEPEEAQLAWDKRILDRVLETKLSDEFYQELLDYVTHQKSPKRVICK